MSQLLNKKMIRCRRYKSRWRIAHKYRETDELMSQLLLTGQMNKYFEKHFVDSTSAVRELPKIYHEPDVILPQLLHLHQNFLWWRRVNPGKYRRNLHFKVSSASLAMNGTGSYSSLLSSLDFVICAYMTKHIWFSMKTAIKHGFWPFSYMVLKGHMTPRYDDFIVLKLT